MKVNGPLRQGESGSKQQEAKGETDRKEGQRLKPLTFQGRRWTYFIMAGPTKGRWTQVQNTHRHNNNTITSTNNTLSPSKKIMVVIA